MSLRQTWHYTQVQRHRELHGETLEKTGGSTVCLPCSRLGVPPPAQGCACPVRMPGVHARTLYHCTLSQEGDNRAGVAPASSFLVPVLGRKHCWPTCPVLGLSCPLHSSCAHPVACVPAHLAVGLSAAGGAILLGLVCFYSTLSKQHNYATLWLYVRKAFHFTV